MKYTFVYYRVTAALHRPSDRSHECRFDIAFQVPIFGDKISAFTNHDDLNANLLVALLRACLLLLLDSAALDMPPTIIKDLTQRRAHGQGQACLWP